MCGIEARVPEKWQGRRAVITKYNFFFFLISHFPSLFQILTLFGIAYLAQWWPAIVSGIWAFVAPIPVPFLVTYVIFHNGGGVFNMLAYTYVRRWSGNASKKPAKANESSNSKSTESTSM